MLALDNKPALLLLEDGTVYKGYAAGKIGTVTGEICFNTGMTGYQEVFTDPSYFGQIMVTTNVHIGNYGVRNDETESHSVKIAGLVCRNFNRSYSRPMASGALQNYFEEEEVVGISGVDTRSLVRRIRQKGAMNAIISSETTDVVELKRQLDATPSMDGLELASRVSTEQAYDFGDSEAGFRVAALDYGIKRSILQCLADRGCYIRVFPARTTLSELEEFGPHGYFLSNGPGDPAAMPYAVEMVRELLKTGKPLFGICLGHQLLALALGMKTFKMHYGHRGLNHPVLNLQTRRSEITSQNHGFGVDPESVQSYADKVEVTHVNLNDQSIEGIRLKGQPVFSVQYHPEASPGPHDARYLFDIFVGSLDN